MINTPGNWIRSICFVRTGGSGDSGAFDRALRICERTGAKLNIVSVVEDPAVGILRLLAPWGTSAEAISGGASESIEGERLAEIARGRGVPASSELLRGKMFLEVCKKVLRDKHDLLIKAAEPTHAVQRVLFGHTDRQLVRKCPCTVWLEKPSAGKTYRRILAAVDPAPFPDDPDFNPAREELNTPILQYAQLLAEVEDAELHIVHVWSFDLERSLRSRAGLDDDAVAEVGESLRQKHEMALAGLVGPSMRNISRVHLMKGHAGEVIAQLAATESIDVIVMGTLCNRGLAGLLIGNTAETVLDHADCSIVALKQPDFVSPIHL